MLTCDSCNKTATVLIDSESCGIEGSFCPKCCNYTPEQTIELWETHMIDFFGVERHFADPDSTASCCKHGRSTPNPYGPYSICPVHGMREEKGVRV